MPVFGNTVLREASKIKQHIKSNGRYSWVETNKKLKGIIVTSNIDEQNIDLINQSLKYIDKKYDEIKDHAAKEMYDHMIMIDSLRGKYASVEDLSKKLKLLSVSFSSFNTDLCNYSMSFDTDPALDPGHLYTVYVYVNIKTGDVSINSSVYDG